MDMLHVQIERLLVGANIALDEGEPPSLEAMATELGQLYAAHVERVGRVRVMVEAGGIAIARGEGRVRRLRISHDGVLWELVDGVTIESPGPIATILASP